MHDGILESGRFCRRVKKGLDAEAAAVIEIYLGVD